jgi:hypothetical protein
VSDEVFVNAVDVTLEMIFSREKLSAKLTLKRFLSGVGPDVFGIVFPGEEVLSTELALVRLNLKS